MKLLTYKLQGDEKERLGVMCANAFQRFYPLETFGLHFQDMNDLIEPYQAGGDGYAPAFFSFCRRGNSEL